MIVCCGEALIDMLPRQTAAGEAVFLPCAGGAVFNTAIALGRLGVETGFFSGVSNDLMGEILAGELTRSNVDLHYLARSDRPTTLAFVKLTNGQARYAFYDEATAGRMLSTSDLPDLPSSAGAMFFGGIWLVNDPSATAFETLQARECAARVTMLDPNIRPAFIEGRETEYRARIGRMIARSDIVKVSDEDLHWLAGEGDTGALARQMLRQGPKIVFVTEGAEGARAFTATQEIGLPGRAVEVADTVGAGDTFNAGVLAALQQAGVLTKPAIGAVSDADLTAALDLGIRAASIVVGRVGANPPWASEV